MDSLPVELRRMVSQSVALLGDVIRHELGTKAYRDIENLRQSMVELRSLSTEASFRRLQKTYFQLSKKSPKEQIAMARSFTLMLELMNACENAFRSHRLKSKPPQQTLSADGEKPQAIIYVLTAHPTEARSPLNIAIFHQIQNFLLRFLDSSSGREPREFQKAERNELLHLLEIAWRISIVRPRAPQVKDEAEHIYSLLFRDDILFSLLDFSEKHIPFYVRSWVGGDKDGHPGVDEKILRQSLTLSRGMILKVIDKQIRHIHETLRIFPSSVLRARLQVLQKKLHASKKLQKRDGQKIIRLRQLVKEYSELYQKEVGARHPALRRLRQIFHVFPGLVVPLELRESSDVLMSKPPKGQKLAIDRMLQTVAEISRGGDPRWYTRGFIISMAESIEHIRQAAHKQRVVFGAARLPVIPLFEEAQSLREAPGILQEFLQDTDLCRAAQDFWDGALEMMVGYSDSAKESGALASRLAIAEALPRLEKVCKSSPFTPIFFHGSGGSIDRGGGSIEDQTSWWPKSALRYYKSTIQGEMVERNLATPEIAHRQLEKILSSAQQGLQKNHAYKSDPALEEFAALVSAAYQERVLSPEFLQMVVAATPYSYLNILKMGSRPAKRVQELQVSSLRAIPWVLCWTQTRVLFQTWWGIGSAWEEISPQHRKALQQSFKNNAVFTSYMNALGFTLAKIEMAVWRLYLEKSSLSAVAQKNHFAHFKTEYEKTRRCYHELTGQKELLWFRPWLAESIHLRSPMIHPLNILQLLAQKNKNMHLLRITVTGISSGMLTTG